MPFFSIIIPSYNRAHILPATIESVLLQSFSDWELIIVDDGSSDNTREVVLGINNERIRYVYQENAERSAARNNGIGHASGSYICFLDSDDFYEKNHLDILYKNIEKQNFPVALFFCHAFYLHDGVKTLPEMHSMDKGPMQYFFSHAVIPAQVCIHNNILLTEKFDEDIVIVEDLVLWVRIAFKYPVYEIQEYTVSYNFHIDNSVNLRNNSNKVRYDGLNLFFKKYPQTAKQLPCKLRRRILSNTLFGVARHYHFMDNYWRMVRYLVLSVAFKPLHKQTKAKIHMMFFPGKHKYK